MDSHTKEVKQQIAINVEDEDQAVDVAQMAPAFQAEGSAQAGGSTQENSHPPTLAEMNANPIVYRRYVRFLADNRPQEPPNLNEKESQKWKDGHLLTATLDHLVEIFKDEKKPREAAYRFYDTWLIVKKEDYIGSPFWYYKSAKSLFRQVARSRLECRKMAGTWQPLVVKKKESDDTWEGDEEEEDEEEGYKEEGHEGEGYEEDGHEEDGHEEDGHEEEWVVEEWDEEAEDA